ncbi:SacI domain protein [Talaromyces proteolyticus]|uniref:SacI domain protein n=1 Tax=Talaromyces proteolyticus TaxID=1131652 RepID=A0AAD4KYW9_9EURO|nr:SacI domain protein [Talaromyces proteolyticus]KAH8699066.1 SacI domain protein [Talaromyces proteolyticus]
MPGLVRKLAIIAAVDGLILQPHGNGNRNGGNSPAPIRIEYRTDKITALAQPQLELVGKRDACLESHGLIGLLNVASYSFLISITQRKQVAQILGKPIYAVTSVVVIPLSSQSDASHAILQAQQNIARQDKESAEAILEVETSSGAEDDSDATAEDIAISSPGLESTENPEDKQGSTNGSRVAQDVISNRGRNGRFSLNWFSRKRWGSTGSSFSSQTKADEVEEEASSERTKQKSVSSALKEQPEAEATHVLDDASHEEKIQDLVAPSKPIDLMPKLLRYTKMLFSSQNFFFSYDYDLTRRYSVPDSRDAQLPPHGLADSLYFWNKFLLKPFIENGKASTTFVLPVIQGFVGQREFTVASSKNQDADSAGPDKKMVVAGETAEETADDSSKEKHSEDFLLTLISRRSTQRPGLRYLRRGVDDDGNTANTVETEQILSTPNWETSRNVYSLLQLRGSIPLYFSQSPYSLKPTPVIHHSNETNQLAFSRHFRDLNRKYGKIQIVSLLDKRGVETKLGEAYEAYTRSFNEEGRHNDYSLGFEWFDFHHECRGMKFENVKGLVDRLEGTLETFGETVMQDNSILKEQSGIVRTNCMDCLDRTGVTQCAFAQRALEKQLKNEGFAIDLKEDSSTQWFNVLWADNGDAISKQYSSTAALKGDYTRTRKRNYRGALNDFGLTLSRYYNNLVSDYFSQACIDYLLGNVSIQVFSEFQFHLQTIDPGISVAKLRQNAIDTCSRLVVDNQSEELLGGWVMLGPRQSNTLRTLPFEETVLLLTDAALYNCRLDWNVDKVVSFERIDLRSINCIRYGTYITSVLSDAQTDEARNVGIVILYQNGNINAFRVNTRSMQSSFNQDAQDNTNTGEEWDLTAWLRGPKKPSARFMAFKALPISTSATNNLSAEATVSESVAVKSICQEIERAIRDQDRENASDNSVIEEKAIISLAEAKKRTGYLEQLVYDVKKLVWA